MQLNFTLLVARSAFVVVLIFFSTRLIGEFSLRFLQLVSWWVFRTSLNISPSRQTGVIVLLPRSVIRSSAIEPVIVARSSYHGLQCVCNS